MYKIYCINREKEQKKCPLFICMLIILNTIFCNIKLSHHLYLDKYSIKSTGSTFGNKNLSLKLAVQVFNQTHLDSNFVKKIIFTKLLQQT